MLDQFFRILFSAIGSFLGFGSDDDKANSSDNGRGNFNDISNAIAPAPVVSGNNTSQTNNITNNVTQNITSATPKQLADSVNSLSTQSINNQRQQLGVY